MAVKTKPVPRIAERPIVGSLGAFQRDRLALLQHIVATCGDVGLMHFGPFPALVLSRPDLVQEVLVDHGADFDKGHDLPAGVAPVSGPGAVHQRGRVSPQAAQDDGPAFQPRNIAVYAETIPTIRRTRRPAGPRGRTSTCPTR